jgi:hypothetical protein
MPDPIKPSRRVLDTIRKAVLQRENTRTKTSNFFMLEEVIPADTQSIIPRQRVVIKRPTVLAFADDAPLLNWAHPCRYLLHDAETGELYQEISAQFPPFGGERMTPKTFRPFHKVIDYTQPIVTRFRPDLVVRPLFDGNRYAILFAGMADNRHTNDLEFFYRTLRHVYRVPKANIYVLNHDGTLNYNDGPKPIVNWPGDNTPYQMPVNGKGSKADLLGVLDDLKTRLKPNDRLFIHTNNHGGHTGVESDLCCFPDWDSLGVKAFTDKLAELPPYRCLMVMMEQCHSGGFNASVLAKSTAQHTSIASACDEFKSSNGGPDFDPFARDWIAAMNGYDPYGNDLVSPADTNGSGRVSAAEAFNYANSIHDWYDTPVFGQVNGGGSCYLGRSPYYVKLPNFVWETPIKKFWPEPDPIQFDRRLERILPLIEQLETELGARSEGLQKEFDARLTEIIKSVR